jgi:2Fe-2S ferredoxin
MRDLEELAQRCVPGRGAVRLERVGGGLLNETYRAERAGCVHALRVAAPQAPEGFAPRGWGCRVAHRAAAAGLAPAVEHCDPDEGILVCRWIPGHAWSAADALVPANVIRFAALLRQVHALAPPSPAHRVSPALWIARYTGLSGGADAPAAKRLCRLAEPALRRLDLLAALPPGAAVLCHGDLHPRNLVDGENGSAIRCSPATWGVHRRRRSVTASTWSAGCTNTPACCGAKFTPSGGRIFRRPSRPRTAIGSCAGWRRTPLPRWSRPVSCGTLRALAANAPERGDTTESRMARMTVVDRDGKEHDVEAKPGLKVMEILRELDYGVAAICGGLCSCATCHVYVEEPWASRLPKRQSDEQDLLTELSDYRPATSRLSCQVEFTEALSGLKVAIAPDT